MTCYEGRVDIERIVARLRAERTDFPNIEVKSAAGGLPGDIERTICAFSNLPGGGTIILGLDERIGFKPVKLRDPNSLKAALASLARQALEPPATIDVTDVVFEKHTLVIGHVTELSPSLKPSVTKRSSAAYMRFWDGDYVLSALEVQAFITARQTPRFDVEPVPTATRGDLDAELIAEFMASVRERDARFRRMGDDDLLRRMAVTTDDGTPTTAGILTLGIFPQQFFPNFCVSAAAAPEQGASPAVRVGDHGHFTGPVRDIIDATSAWVATHSRRRIIDGERGRVFDQDEFPDIAVRELVANSLIHRDLAPWSWSRAVEIRITDRKLVIINPGGLYGITPDKLGSAMVSSARNPQLLRICQHVKTSDGRTIEALATGIARAFEATDRQQLPRPTFFDQALTFTAIMHRPYERDAAPASTHQLPDGITRAQSEVMTALSAGPLSLAEIADLLNTTHDAIRGRLTRLRKLGYVEFDGGQGSHDTRYRRSQR